MPTYTCSKCARVFKQKSGYDDHMKKKNDCGINTALDAIIETKVKETIRTTNQHKQEVTKETLPAFFEDLHNLLWNKAGLSPERALEHMTFFFAYRLIEQQADALSLPQECRWLYLASQKDDDSTLATMRKGCVSFQKNIVTKPFFKKPEIDKAEIVHEIVQQINRISLTVLQETDTLGDIFEYMLGRGMSTMSDEGQYFTNRAICKLAFKLAYDIKKNLRREDGTLCTFADWFCGTGGFPAEFIKGVKANLPSVDWKKDFTSIYCQDMNLSSVTTTLLNMLILTGIPFSGDKIRGSNSFSEPITTGSGAPFNGVMIDYCFMNPPYGGDKSKGKEYKFAYSKKVKGEDGSTTKKFFVNQEIQSIGIEDDDKVSAGVQLAMATLSADGGVCSIVLPQGFFFGTSKKCVELRKRIAEEYKIWYVVDIASGSFLNTGTKTSMMVFQKGVGATEKVVFIGLDEKPLVEATLEELRSKHYSLNYKQYLPQSAVEVEGFDMVKLGDIVKPSSMKHRSTPDGNKTGKYPLISSALNVEYYMDTFDSEIPSLIFNTINADGNCSVHYYEKFNVTSNTYVLSGENKLTLQYIYYYLKTQPKLLKGCFEGTTKKALSRPLLQSLEIPLPSLERQQQIVEAIDGWAGLAQQEEVALKILEKQMMFQVKEMGRGQARVKLGEVCEFKRGKPLAKKDFVDGTVPVIGGGIKPVGTHNVHNRESYSILISQSGTAGHISRYSKPVWASDCFSLDPKSNIIHDYLYYSVLHLKETIDFLKEGTAQPHVYPSTIQHLEIHVPPLADQQTLEAEFDEIRHKHAKIATYKAKAQEAIQRLIPS
jgi:type I restriction enzyme S subunit